MSLILLDIAYIGTKGLLNVGYYLAKGSYNLVAGMAGYEPIQEAPTETELLLQEIRSLKTELQELKGDMLEVREIALCDTEKGEVKAVKCGVGEAPGNDPNQNYLLINHPSREITL